VQRNDNRLRKRFDLLQQRVKVNVAALRGVFQQFDVRPCDERTPRTKMTMALVEGFS
jgi:hypothetical protein